MGRKSIYSKSESNRRRKEAMNRAVKKYLDERKRFQVTLTLEEAAAIVDVAKKKGVSPTAFIHDVAVKAAFSMLDKGDENNA